MCEVEGCDRAAYSRGRCEPHYRRWLRTGDVRAEVPIGERPSPPECMANGCERTATERGLCHGHYLRLIRTGSIADDLPLDRRKNFSCTVKGCDNRATSHGLCGTHRRRRSKTGSVQPELPIRQVEGTGHISHGYRVVPIPASLRGLTRGRRTELEHRFVMAQMLGRPLTADESVHHRNGDRLDNDPSNLELWSRFQPRGQRVADKVTYALAVLDRYLPDALAVQPPLMLPVEHDDD